MKKFALFISFILMISISSYAGEKDTYKFKWLDPDKEVYVIQNRAYRKEKKAHLSLGAGLTTNGPFVDAMNFQLRGGYFFHEDWGIELVYSLGNGDENDVANAVRNSQSTVGAGSIPFRRIMDSYFGGMILWSPFYGKFNTFNTVLYIDWMLGLGLASFKESNNRTELLTNGSNKTVEEESHMGLMWGTGLKFYINKDWHVKFDFTAIHYQAEQVYGATANQNDKILYSHYDLTLGIGLNF